ncbi:MAG: hypothetical protein MMC33_006567 [Icmadophila ericetorum]|nr:hypothetical protein [Icmadophila ericetorum]
MTLQTHQSTPSLNPYPLLSTLALADVAYLTARYLLDAYSEPQRHYHTLEHIQSMLSLLPDVQSYLNDEEETIVQLAIWFHDCVYDPRAKVHGDNERRSVEKWVEFAEKMEPPQPEIQKRVSTLIGATISHQLPSPKDPLCALFLDLDLSILASPPQIYDMYAKNIREEYSNFNDKQYRQGRIEILEKFLEKEQIFMSEVVRGREGQARGNIGREIERLRAGIGKAG